MKAGCPVTRALKGRSSLRGHLSFGGDAIRSNGSRVQVPASRSSSFPREHARRRRRASIGCELPRSSSRSCSWPAPPRDRAGQRAATVSTRRGWGRAAASPLPRRTPNARTATGLPSAACLRSATPRRCRCSWDRDLLRALDGMGGGRTARPQFSRSLRTLRRSEAGRQCSIRRPISSDRPLRPGSLREPVHLPTGGEVNR